MWGEQVRAPSPAVGTRSTNGHPTPLSPRARTRSGCRRTLPTSSPKSGRAPPQLPSDCGVPRASPMRPRLRLASTTTDVASCGCALGGPCAQPRGRATRACRPITPVVRRGESAPPPRSQWASSASARCLLPSIFPKVCTRCPRARGRAEAKPLLPQAPGSSSHSPPTGVCAPTAQRRGMDSGGPSLLRCPPVVAGARLNRNRDMPSPVPSASPLRARVRRPRRERAQPTRLPRRRPLTAAGVSPGRGPPPRPGFCQRWKRADAGA